MHLLILSGVSLLPGRVSVLRTSKRKASPIQGSESKLVAVSCPGKVRKAIEKRSCNTSSAHFTFFLNRVSQADEIFGNSHRRPTPCSCRRLDRRKPPEARGKGATGPLGELTLPIG